MQLHLSIFGNTQDLLDKSSSLENHRQEPGRLSEIMLVSQGHATVWAIIIRGEDCPRAMLRSGPSCYWWLCLGLWSYSSWGLWWCPWLMLPQEAKRTHAFEIGGPYWTGYVFHCPWDSWPCPFAGHWHQESWPLYSPGKMPHSPWAHPSPGKHTRDDTIVGNAGESAPRIWEQ